MNLVFGILTVVFIVLSAGMILVILVQRASGGGLAGAFGGAGGGGTDTVFGGRVGDALTVITVIGFVLWLGLAVSLNLVESEPPPTAQPAAETTEVGDPDSGLPEGGATGVATPIPLDTGIPATDTDSTTDEPATDGADSESTDNDDQPTTTEGDDQQPE